MEFPYRHELEDRFLRYVQINTQSDEASDSVPSTAGQLELLRLLERELSEIGISKVDLTTKGTLVATIPASDGQCSVPPLAFFSHVDTAPAYDGDKVIPRVHRAYKGSAIDFPHASRLQLDPETHPYLQSKIGDDIVTASGKTLLGADDKAGVTVMMTLANLLVHDHAIGNGPIRLVFTSDEEIGTGVRHVDLDQVDAAFGFTLDGQELGELTFETFSADKAVVAITGVSAHPGYAQGVMVNALTLAAKLIDFLPQHTNTPETTADRQGFIHAYQITGTAAHVEVHLILRDFELDGLATLRNVLQSACDSLAAAEPRAAIDCKITAQYRNMRYWLENDMAPVALAQQAMRHHNIEPLVRPIRGGTDGSQLTERGLPTPNLFTGMQNIHGPLEWISIQDMHRCLDVCLSLVELWTVQNAGRQNQS